MQHFPTLIATLFAIYVPAFVYSLIYTSPYEVIADEIEIVTHEIVDDVDDDEVPGGETGSSIANGKSTASLGEELDVEKTLVLEEKDPQILRTLLAGLPSPTSTVWSALSLGINVVLLAMVWDVIYRTPLFYPSHDLSFARIGYVSSSSAKILVREPDVSRLPLFVSYRYAEQPYLRDAAWKSGGSIGSLDESTDYTGIFEVKGLQADTKYQYVANNRTGFFTTAPLMGQVSSRTDDFTFLTSSCLKNRLPYNPLAHPLSNQGLKYLAQTLRIVQAQFMLFLGDFIYVDVPRRQGTDTEAYRREYRQMYASPDWPAAARIPWIHVYDDHEVANDWDGNTTGLFAAANDPYSHYHISVNPPAAREGETYFSFTQGPATFFMLDTRRYRSPNDATNGSDPVTGEATKTMLGKEQLTDLLAWLSRPEPQGVRWKIMVTSVPFTKNWWLNAQDTWRGYLGERQVILEAMWDVGLRGGVGVVILSGDRHEFAATAFPPPPDGKEEIVGLGALGVGANPLAVRRAQGSEVATLRTKRKYWPLSSTVHEFSTSPLNMFYLPIRTYAESSTSPDYVSDVCIKYAPDGNSKFGAVSISTPSTADQSEFRFRLFVDGMETWSYLITTPPNTGGGGRAKDAIWG